jgi:hypothetical protein
MKYREQRGYYTDSMKTMVELSGTKQDLYNHILNVFTTKNVAFPHKIDDMYLHLYDQIEDLRNGWKKTYLVKFRTESGCFGMTDSSFLVEEPKQDPNQNKLVVDKYYTLLSTDHSSQSHYHGRIVKVEAIQGEFVYGTLYDLNGTAINIILNVNDKFEETTPEVVKFFLKKKNNLPTGFRLVSFHELI